MRRIRSRLSYANVTESLPMNSVRSTNIVNGQVSTADIGTGQVISSDIRDGSIGVADLSPAVVDRLKKAPKANGKENVGKHDGQTTTPTSTTNTPTTPITPLP
jgi:hypothetical protein